MTATPTTRRTRPADFALWLALLAAGCSSEANPMTCEPWGTAEQVAARPSPFDSVEVHSDLIWMKLCYSRPSARGRVVFGELVPYDTLWRTGANEATVLHTTHPITIAGVDIDAGKYSIYTVPSPRNWALVINGMTGQWGLTQDAYGARGNFFENAYTEEVRTREIARMPIETESVAYTETLTASFDRRSADSTNLVIDWEETRILIPIHIRQNE